MGKGGWAGLMMELSENANLDNLEPDGRSLGNLLTPAG